MVVTTHKSLAADPAVLPKRDVSVAANAITQEQPVAEQPVPKQPVAEQPVTDQPVVAEQPVTQQPVAEQPVAVASTAVTEPAPIVSKEAFTIPTPVRINQVRLFLYLFLLYLCWYSSSLVLVAATAFLLDKTLGC